MTFFTCSASANIVSSNEIPKALKGIGIDQNLNQQVPLDIPFLDEQGKAVRLSNFLGKTPAILVLAYYECSRLCTMVLNGVGDVISKTKLRLGKDFQIITVSINPKDSSGLATAKKASYVQKFAPASPAGWHFLTGSESSITRLANSVGFRYRYDPKTKEVIHAVEL